ncbi:MAG: leucine-rich repeat domain-containing protein [Candidatus Hodarchaeota archaeon]
MRDGILFYIRPYPLADDNDSILSYPLDDIIHQAELYRTFTDYKICRTADPEKTYIPYSLFDKMYINPPDWVSPIGDENRIGSIKFPYITLEAIDPDVEALVFKNSATKEIVGIEALQGHQNLQTIYIDDKHSSLEKLDFPSDLFLPKLEHLEVRGVSPRNLDLSFIQNCSNIQTIIIRIWPTSSSTHEITIPSLNHHFLEYIAISGGFESITLTPSWYCPNLQGLYLSHNPIETINLGALANCPSLEVFLLNDYQGRTLNLDPLQHCPDLEELSLYHSQIEEIDLSPLKHCSNLRKLILSHNRLKNLDLSPLKTHPSLEKVNLSGNKLERLDLSPLVDCPNLKIVNLRKNPIDKFPVTIFKEFYQKDLEIIL